MSLWYEVKNINFSSSLLCQKDYNCVLPNAEDILFQEKFKCVLKFKQG